MAKEEEEDIIIVAETISIEEGKHTGTITDVIVRTSEAEGYEYVDIHVDTDDDKGETVNIKFGFPKYISVNSSFGKFLTETGFSFEAGDTVTLPNIKEHLKGKEITFQTMNEDVAGKGIFARILRETVKVS